MSYNKFEKAYLNIINECDGNCDKESNEADMQTEAVEQNEVQTVCFKTSDPNLIDAINSGFEEVVFFVKAKDDDGEDTVVEAKFTPESFGDIIVTKEEIIKEDMLGAGIGAAGGAAVGSLFGPIGTIVGAAAGGAIGS